MAMRSLHLRSIPKEIGNILSKVQRELPSSRRLLVWVNFDKVSTELWRRLFNVHFALILDFRAFPRFDIGGLNRRTAFSMFKNNNIMYMDMTGGITDNPRRALIIDPATMLQKICEAAASSERKVVLVIVDKSSSIAAVERAIVPYLVKTTGAIWSSIACDSIGTVSVPAS